MKEFKRGILAREGVQQAVMVKRWMQVEARLMGDMQALGEEISRTATSGYIFTDAQLMKNDRYRALLAQTRVEMTKYERWADTLISDGQAEMGKLGIDHAVKTIQAGQVDAGLRLSFNRLPVEATQYMVGICADGAPLFDVLAQRALLPDAIDGLRTALLQGTSLGWNPRKTAKAMADGLTDGLQKALVIARDSQLRVYRAASDAEYRASGVVQDKVRVCAKDERTCLACLAKDGEVLGLNEPGFDHTQGRCTFVPRVVGMDAIDFVKGPRWFDGLDESKQREMMGPALFKAWDHGRGFDFTALATITQHETWGQGLAVTPLSQLASAQ
jgi:hypothetical protein